MRWTKDSRWPSWPVSLLCRAWSGSGRADALVVVTEVGGHAGYPCARREPASYQSSWNIYDRHHPFSSDLKDGSRMCIYASLSRSSPSGGWLPTACR
jgi:hypothetical protein